MSSEDNHPAQRDTARPVYPVILDKTGGYSPHTDFRAQVLPADAPEVEDEGDGPKGSSVPERAVSSESTKVIVPPTQATPVPETPAGKGNGTAKVPSAPGSRASSAPTTTGKTAPPAGTKTP